MLLPRVVPAVGNLASACVLLCADALSALCRLPALAVVFILDRSSGSGEGTARQKQPWHPQRYSTAPVLAEGAAAYGALDVERTLASSTFPIKPDRLVALAKEVLAQEFGTAAEEVTPRDHHRVQPPRADHRVRPPRVPPYV